MGKLLDRIARAEAQIDAAEDDKERRIAELGLKLAIHEIVLDYIH